jgi:GntR family transcriptional repressor for pyruvate dehydrogenase complex
VAHDLEFHGAIVEAAGNSYMTTLTESLSGKTARARIWRGLTQENSVSRTLAEHKAIVDAIANHDSQLAEALTVAHISGVEQWLRTWVQEQP